MRKSRFFVFLYRRRHLEEALTSVCRYYPRGVHTVFRQECSCANSCEKVLEMLFEMDAPIKFEERTLAFELPELKPETENIAARHYGYVRKLVIDALQNRQYGLPERLTLA